VFLIKTLSAAILLPTGCRKFILDGDKNIHDVRVKMLAALSYNQIDRLFMG
jgi:hypothetical protein